MIQADIECAIRSEANVLISGGDSAARTALARLIHERSKGRDRSLVVLGGGRSIERPTEHADTSSESGASGRTLFIEELAALDESAQDELMRLLDNGPEPFTDEERDTRIISGTAHNLMSRMASRLFKASLFYRLNVIHIALDDGRRLAKPSSIH